MILQIDSKWQSWLLWGSEEKVSEIWDKTSENEIPRESHFSWEAAKHNG